MYDPKQLRSYIKDVLWVFSSMLSKQLDTDDVIELLMLTAAHESRLGTYLHQWNGGPARGIFQIELATWSDIWNNYLKHRPTMYAAVKDFESKAPQDIDMKGNLALQIVMARVHYLRVPEAIPSKKNLYEMALYYKRYWNTYLGAATIKGAMESYKRYVKGEV